VTGDDARAQLASQVARSPRRGSFAARYLGEVTVKGKVVPVKIYSVEGGPESRMV